MASQDASPEELQSCLPGDRLIDFYEDDDRWHERILIWRGAAEHGWVVLTPDLQDYSLTGGDNGPSKFRIKGRQVTYYSRLRAPVHRFATEPSEADMRG